MWWPGPLLCFEATSGVRVDSKPAAHSRIHGALALFRESADLINHNDAESVSHKLDCIVDQDLGGIMFWKLSGDDAQHSLIHPMAGTLRTASP